METMLLMANIWSWFGAIMTILCYLPQTVKTILTRNTVGLSRWFFILGFLCSVGWIMGSLFSGIANPTFDALSLAVLISNIIGLLCNFIIMWIKCLNVYRAKRAKLTEHIYCEQQFEIIRSKRAYIARIIKIIDKL